MGVGASGFTEALGVVVGQKDMTDIVDAIELGAAYPDIVRVYLDLLAGSERHLTAFLNVLDTSAAEASSEGSKRR